MRCLPSPLAHHNLQHHRNAIKAVKMTPMVRHSKSRYSNQIKKKLELQLGESLRSEEATGLHSESEE